MARCFSTDDQLYAAAGYMVVYANPRGSTSYGEDVRQRRSTTHYPSHDYDDLMSVVDAAIAKGYGRSRTTSIVTGGSGGGGADRLDRRQDRPLPRRGGPEAGDQLVELRCYRRRLQASCAKYWFGKMPWEDPRATGSARRCRWSAT